MKKSISQMIPIDPQAKRLKITQLFSKGVELRSFLDLLRGAQQLIRHAKITGFFLLLNGDVDAAEVLDRYYFNPAFGRRRLTVSYACLSRLVSANGADDFKKVREAIADDSLILVDFTGDTEINFTKQEKAMANDPSRLKTPVGFTQIDGYIWHRAATALFYDRQRTCYYLLGQDEGTYFGVEISGERVIRTVNAAFKALIPVQAQGSGVLRQGEWFVVPVKEKDLPPLNKRAWAEKIVLPMETPDSKPHCIFAQSDEPQQFQQLFVATNGRVFAKNFALRHEDHTEIYCKDHWYTFVRNTAVRSFSQEGVD